MNPKIMLLACLLSIGSASCESKQTPEEWIPPDDYEWLECLSHDDCWDADPCTTDTCNDRGFCEHVEISTCAKELVCGNTANRSCKAPKKKKADLNEKHEVRCCSDTNTAWRHPTHSNTCKNILGRDVYGESDNGFGCNAGKTFDEANAICSSVSARLCTVDELEAGLLWLHLSQASVVWLQRP